MYTPAWHGGWVVTLDRCGAREGGKLGSLTEWTNSLLIDTYQQARLHRFGESFDCRIDVELPQKLRPVSGGSRTQSAPINRKNQPRVGQIFSSITTGFGFAMPTVTLKLTDKDKYSEAWQCEQNDKRGIVRQSREKIPLVFLRGKKALVDYVSQERLGGKLGMSTCLGLKSGLTASTQALIHVAMIKRYINVTRWRSDERKCKRREDGKTERSSSLEQPNLHQRAPS
ncbi:hypothetical protein EDD18DRAFT_1113544 [Armillaria luteobubalina]|uniref:Uncharacterized protein n=1 Tax=Armillaria luteobubalina TaxID=153913 RepID=A0AA39PA66_9AGAR|nr:hypothetical protein EDD18DRAFT_1113544 [Armillaria luteobubalina]